MAGQITFIVKPVATRCNLKCGYCYNHNFWVDHQNLMSDFVLKELIRQSASISKEMPVSFVWHGGEPLLAGRGFYEKVTSFQGKYFNSLPCRNSLQTNGTLIDSQWAIFFRENELRVGVSLDGPKDVHDAFRVFKNSMGSFNSVMQGIDNLRERDIGVSIISVVTSKSMDKAEEILDFFVAQGLKRMNFSYCAEKINGKISDFSVSPVGYADFMIKIFNHWMKKDNPEIKIQLLENLFQGLIGGKPTLCYCSGECSSYIAVDINGDLYLCGRFLGIEEFKIGNICEQEMSVLFRSEKFSRLSCVTDSLRKECLLCKWKLICGGGCSYYRYMNGGLLSSQYYFCSSTKKLLNHMFLTIQRLDPSSLVDLK